MALAALAWEGHVFFAEREPAPHEPFSSITDLIQGLWAKDPKMARKILRGRILSSDLKPREMDRGFIQVAAKRASFGLTQSDIEHALQTPRSQWVQLAAPPPSIGIQTRLDSSHSPMHGLQKLLNQEARLESKPRFEQNRRVAAAFISAQGEVLGATMNTNAQDRTRHAEVNLIQSWWLRERKPLPKGAKLYVTLRCCRMCAARIWDACEDPWSLQVFWHEDDPGRMAQNTVLQAGTPARRRVAGSLAQLQHTIETQNPCDSY